LWEEKKVNAGQFDKGGGETRRQCFQNVSKMERDETARNWGKNEKAARAGDQKKKARALPRQTGKKGLGMRQGWGSPRPVAVARGGKEKVG